MVVHEQQRFLTHRDKLVGEAVEGVDVGAGRDALEPRLAVDRPVHVLADREQIPQVLAFGAERRRGAEDGGSAVKAKPASGCFFLRPLKGSRYRSSPYLSVPATRWLQMMLAVSIACLACLALAGCGGSEGFTSENVAEKITGMVRSDLPEDATMDPFRCVRDGDDEHYRCVADAVNQGKAQQLVLQVTCDAKRDECLYEQVR